MIVLFDSVSLFRRRQGIFLLNSSKKKPFLGGKAIVWPNE